MAEMMLTVKQIADIYNVNPSSVSFWFRTGILKGYKEKHYQTRRWVTTMEDLIQFNRLNPSRRKVKAIRTLEEEKLYTTQDLCDIFGVSRELVSRWRKQGQLKAYGTNKKPYVYLERAVVEFTENYPKYYYMFMNKTEEG